MNIAVTCSPEVLLWRDHQSYFYRLSTCAIRKLNFIKLWHQARLFVCDSRRNWLLNNKRAVCRIFFADYSRKKISCRNSWMDRRSLMRNKWVLLRVVMSNVMFTHTTTVNRSFLFFQWFFWQIFTLKVQSRLISLRHYHF